ncbi:MAG: tetratricopeptide repeat protein [Egibacteraceae bacterium]
MTEQAWTHAFEAGEEPVRSAASVCLGMLYADRGDDEDAITALERADTSVLTPSAQAGPRSPSVCCTTAACRRGQWLWCHGEHAAADAAFLRGWLAHSYEGDDVTARACSQQAANNLGVLLVGHGEHDEALAMFRSVEGYPRCTATAKAAFNAGLLLERAGQTGQARVAFEQAIDAANPVVLPRAVAHLARLLLRANDKDAASALLDRWRNADDPELAASVADAFEELHSCPTPHGLRLLTEPW